MEKALKQKIVGVAQIHKKKLRDSLGKLGDRVIICVSKESMVSV